MFSGKKFLTSMPNRLAAVVMLMMAVMPIAPGASAQETDAYEAELLDWTVEATGPNYILENVELEEYPHGRGERIYITSVDSLGFVEVSFFDDDDAPDDTIELMIRDFESASRSLDVLDRGHVGEVHYALVRFQLEQGFSGYFYIEVAQDIEGNVDLSQSMYTLDADFLEQLEIVQSEISLAGMSFLAEPVIDLDSIIPEDQALLASTPDPVPTPDQGSYTYRTSDAELVVDGNIEFDFPLINRELDVMFISSTHGYGVVGFIDQVAESPESVLASVFLDAPAGQEAPRELYIEHDDSRVFGVYRVETQGETRVMIIEITSIDEDRWRVEAMAVTESEFASELADYQSDVTFDNEPLLGDVNADDIFTILNDNE